MTKQGKRRQQKHAPRPVAAPTFLDQLACTNCGRYHLRGADCWFCEPRWPDPCICDVIVPAGVPAFPQHVHLEHELLERLSQLDYESVDETILLATEFWPVSADDVLQFDHEELVGVATTNAAAEPSRHRASRPDWRKSPEYRAFLRRYPSLRTAAKSVESMVAFFGMTKHEGDAWAGAAAGYTVEAIAKDLRLKPGGVERLLEVVQSKIGVKLARLDDKIAKAG